MSLYEKRIWTGRRQPPAATCAAGVGQRARKTADREAPGRTGIPLAPVDCDHGSFLGSLCQTGTSARDSGGLAARGREIGLPPGGARSLYGPPRCLDHAGVADSAPCLPLKIYSQYMFLDRAEERAAAGQKSHGRSVRPGRMPRRGTRLRSAGAGCRDFSAAIQALAPAFSARALTEMRAPVSKSSRNRSTIALATSSG